MEVIFGNSEDTGFTLETAYMSINDTSRNLSISCIILYKHIAVNIFSNTHILKNTKENGK